MRAYRPLAVVLLCSVFAGASPADDPMRGFASASARSQREWETKFMSIPEPARMRAAMERLTMRPHHIGSPGSLANAEWIRDQFRAYGWQAEIETFTVLFPTPVERVVELVSPTRFKAGLEEPAVPGDPSTAQKSEQLPTFNAYSIDGDVTGPLVFVNYGIPADYEELARRGISVKGAIVIAKYGGSWRGIKPKVAAENGAIGCIIYSDPRDDGYAIDSVYPKGPMRPATGVQRGSVADMPVFPGDPLTPFIGSTPGAKRLALAEAPTITKIPVLPISHADAQPLLAALGGRAVPAAWRGGLPITYRTGPGPARVHLKVRSRWEQTPVYNVIARLPGTTEAEQWVLRGNHHDAWVNGAEDPISGLVAELEEARALGEIYRQGWRPKRTIVYAAWDAEEPGLLGSTEWVETHAQELRERAVAYINTDATGRGFFSVGGSHSLEKFINEIMRVVPDPEANVSVWTRSRAAAISGGDAEARARDIRIGALGSGSDYSPFLQHAGIAALDMSYGGEDDGGIYHSIYDTFRWFTQFSDTSFVYGRALAQTTGLAVMRLADADILPHAFGNLAETASRYAKELQELRDARAKSIEERIRQIDEGTYDVVNDPRNPLLPPKRETVPPRFEFAPMLNALDALDRAAKSYEAEYSKWLARTAGGITGDAAAYRALNEQLLQAERALTAAEGLNNRPWYRHMLYAPGFYTGYGVKTMSGVREAIEQGQWPNVNGEIERIAASLQREADLVAKAAVAIAALR